MDQTHATHSDQAPRRFRPLHDFIIVRRAATQTKTAGGLFIPSQAQEKLVEGTVLAIGTGLVHFNGRHQRPEVKVGDRILFHPYMNVTEMVIPGCFDDEKVCVMREEVVQAIYARADA